jgi:hypothetical protein
MSLNRERPHVHFLAEDDANRQLVNGFLLHPDVNIRQLKKPEVADGWRKALEICETDRFQLRHYPYRHLILAIDFDGKTDRREKVLNLVPDDLRRRIFVLGVLSEPEDLKQQRGLSFEDLGLALAEGCRDGSSTLWQDSLLAHNTIEIERMRASVLPILFGTE